MVGDNIGFGIGWFGGYPLLRRFGKYVRLDEAKLKVGRYIFMRHGAKVVFFGRFVSVLRTYAAFLAGTNRMHWSRFLIANAAGAIVWAMLYGIGAYSASSVIAKLSTPVAIGFAALAVVVIVLAGFFVGGTSSASRRSPKRRCPVPLEGFSGKPEPVHPEPEDPAGSSDG